MLAGKVPAEGEMPVRQGVTILPGIRILPDVRGHDLPKPDDRGLRALCVVRDGDWEELGGIPGSRPPGPSWPRGGASLPYQA